MSSLVHFRLRLISSTILVLSSQAGAVFGCYCDETPFWRLAASADFVVIGRIGPTDHGQVPLKPGKTWAPRYWVSTVEVSQVIKGTPPAPFVVGGYGSSCDFAEPVFRKGDVYAFAFSRKMKTPQGFYWMEMCNKGGVGIRGQSEYGEASIEEVVRWARATPPAPAKRPQNKQMQRTRPAQAMAPRR
jgi:hypothetical protein